MSTLLVIKNEILCQQCTSNKLLSFNYLVTDRSAIVPGRVDIIMLAVAVTVNLNVMQDDHQQLSSVLEDESAHLCGTHARSVGPSGRVRHPHRAHPRPH